MPLHWGTSNHTREQNIREMIASGMPPKQAEAAAYAKQRASAKAVMAETGPTGFAPPNYRGATTPRLPARPIVQRHSPDQAGGCSLIG